MAIIYPEGTQNLPSRITQIQTSTITTHTTYLGTSFVDTGMTCNITPRSSSSVILVHFYPCFSASDNAYVAFRIYRDSTFIWAGNSSYSSGTGVECTFGFSFHDEGNLKYSAPVMPVVAVDSPNTTSSTTYKLQFSPMRTSNERVYLNRSHNLGDSNQFVGRSTMTLTEVEA